MRSLVPSPPPSPVPGVIALDDFAPDEGEVFGVFEDFVEDAGEFLMDDGEIEEEILDDFSDEESEGEDERPDSPLDSSSEPDVPELVPNLYFFNRVIEELEVSSDSEGEMDPDFNVRVAQYFVRDASPDAGDEE